MDKRVLIVGAGAVGKVFALALQRAGMAVTFYLKPNHIDAMRGGFSYYALNQRPRWEMEQSVAFPWVTSSDEVGQSSWDYVILTVSSTALRGTWLESLMAAVGDAPVLSIQPGIDAHERLLALIPEERLMSLMVSFIAFNAPLDERAVAPGLAYWYPPMSPSLLSGPVTFTDTLRGALKGAGFPVKVVDDAVVAESSGAAVLMSFLAALEAADWKFKSLTSDRLRLVTRGVGEASSIVASRLGTKPSKAGVLLCPMTMRSILWTTQKTFPFDIEVYLKYHFTKVGDQTRYLLDRYIEIGAERGLPSDHLVELRGLLEG